LAGGVKAGADKIKSPVKFGFSSRVADTDISPPLCFVEMPTTALLMAGLTPSGSDRFTPLLSP
jgi:hypothetical protein